MWHCLRVRAKCLPVQMLSVTAARLEPEKDLRSPELAEFPALPVPARTKLVQG
jgi:hypothetical protein